MRALPSVRSARRLAESLGPPAPQRRLPRPSLPRTMRATTYGNGGADRSAAAAGSRRSHADAQRVPLSDSPIDRALSARRPVRLLRDMTSPTCTRPHPQAMGAGRGPTCADRSAYQLEGIATADLAVDLRRIAFASAPLKIAGRDPGATGAHLLVIQRLLRDHAHSCVLRGQSVVPALQKLAATRGANSPAPVLRLALEGWRARRVVRARQMKDADSHCGCRSSRSARRSYKSGDRSFAAVSKSRRATDADVAIQAMRTRSCSS